MSTIIMPTIDGDLEVELLGVTFHDEVYVTVEVQHPESRYPEFITMREDELTLNQEQAVAAFKE